jgi:hypothetical protein
MSRDPVTRVFDELHGDPLDDLLDPSAPVATRTATPPADYRPPSFEEPCRKCGGSGVFRGWSGRSSGQCFACKGTGKLQFKTSRETRQRNVASAARRRVNALEAFQRDHAAEWVWMQATAPRFEFAAKMLEVVTKGRALSENQLAAVQRCVARDAERARTREAERVARESAARPIDMAKITEAFGRAASILRFPRLRVAGVIFALPSRSTEARANGIVYAKSEAGTYLGKITGGRFVRSRECTDEQERMVLEAAVDPQEAAIRYGRLTGNCACCGRLLSAEDSLGRGIGPICAENFGW